MYSTAAPWWIAKKEKVKKVIRRFGTVHVVLIWLFPKKKKPCLYRAPKYLFAIRKI
jgi:hypothetical protein